ncbi:MAG: hypothetical protein HXY40_14955 [Chloroflexi bacterium]|nr:hypothetical protein [Chloroflexota bacterium]
MPTPFTHLETAQRFVCDEQLPPDVRQFLKDQASAFLLGSIAADAKPSAGGERASTHFYAYDRPISESPWRVMLRHYPALQQASTPAQRVFLAGYVGHLAIDEYWTMNMLGPHIAFSQWGESRRFRFYVLHLLLAYMDERDLARLESWIPHTLAAAGPQQWTPFLDDSALISWRDMIYEQIKPGGVSQTLDIMSARVGKNAAEMRRDLDARATLQAYLWDNITPSTLAQIEAAMYTHARDQLLAYWREY